MNVEFEESVAPPSARVPRPVRIVNIVATLRPSAAPDTGRIFVVSGHYDSRASDALDSTGDAPGADDDGSGTAVVLELARVMSAHRFASTILFAAFAGEEQGLLGSTALAAAARERGWKIEGVLNNDIVGSSRGGDGRKENAFVRVFSEAYSPLDTGSFFRRRNTLGLENDGNSRSLARYVFAMQERYLPAFAVRMIYRRDRFLRGGDQQPFHEKGFAAVRLTEAAEDFDHQHQNVRVENGRAFGDVVAAMDFEYCANVARVNAAALASLAMAPAAPVGVELVTRNLEYQTELKWRKSPDPRVWGYSIRYRETSSPVWQGSRFITDTTASLPISKDDFIFGVQSVDAEGNESLVTIPTPSGR